MPKLLLYVYSSNLDDNANYDVAVVDLSPALACVGLTRMDRVRTLTMEDADLCAMHYLDFSIAYCSVYDALDEMVERLTGTDVFAALDTRECVILPEEFAVPEEHVRQTEATEMVVTDTELCWKAMLRHTSVVVSTSRLSRIQFEAWAQTHAGPVPEEQHRHLSCGPADCVGLAAVQGLPQFWTLANAALSHARLSASAF